MLYHPPQNDTAKPREGGRETNRRRRAKKPRKKKTDPEDADEASEEAEEGNAEARGT